jgi:hypothetical protein
VLFLRSCPENYLEPRRHGLSNAQHAICDKQPKRSGPPLTELLTSFLYCFVGEQVPFLGKPGTNFLHLRLNNCRGVPCGVSFIERI